LHQSRSWRLKRDDHGGRRGHVDRAMMEHYSHVRMAAKRDVLPKLESGLMEIPMAEDGRS